MLGIKIRQYQDADSDQVKSLQTLALQAVGGAYGGKWDEDLNNISDIYLREGDFLVVTAKNKIIAMGALKKISKDIVELKRMRVHPDFQRQGLGQLLIDHLEYRAKELGYKTIQLDTTLKQVGAQNLYEKNGYIEIRRATDGLPSETIFYEKSLVK